MLSLDLGDAKERWLLALVVNESLASEVGIAVMEDFRKRAGVPFCLLPLSQNVAYGQFWPWSELPCLITPMGLVIGSENIRRLTHIGLAQLSVLFGDVKAEDDQFTQMLQHRFRLARRAVTELLSARWDIDGAIGCRYWARRYQATLALLQK